MYIYKYVCVCARTFQLVVFGHPLTATRLFIDTSFSWSWYVCVCLH